jgi:hypothetical protein
VEKKRWLLPLAAAARDSSSTTHPRIVSALKRGSVNGILALRSTFDLLLEVYTGSSALACRLSVSHGGDCVAVSGCHGKEIELEDLSKVAGMTPRKCLCTGEGAFDCKRDCGWVAVA